MAKINYLVDIDLAGNQLTNFVVQHINADPSAYEGGLFYHSGSNVLKFHNGSSWVSLSSNQGDVTGVGAGAGLTGTDLNGPVPTLNVVGGTGITANADNIAITAGGVGTTQLTDDGVTADKLANSINSAIAANTAKNTNVTTNLSITGSTGARTIASSDGNNAVIPVATTSVSGVMSPTTFDAVTANSAKNTNVSTNLSVANSTTSRVIASSDGTNATIPVATTSVSGVMSTGIFDAVVLNTAKNTNVSTNLGITGSTGARTITSSDGNNVVIPIATTSVSGVMSKAIFDEHTANNAKATNTDTNVDVTTLETRLGQINSNITIGNASSVNTTISGDLIVNGDTTTVTSTTVAIGDNMMKMAKDNSANSKDIGWYGKIVAEGTKFPSMFYDASSGVGTPVFQVGLATTEPGTGAATIATKGTVSANLTGNVTGNVTGNTSGSSGSCTGNAATSSKISSITNSNIVQLTASQTLTNKTIAASQVTEISNITAAEGAQLENINSVTISNAQWGYLGAATGAITNTDTVDMGSGFVIEDGDGTEVVITENKEIKFVEGGNIDINFTDTNSGSDSDPFDLTFTVPNAAHNVVGAVELATTTEALAGSDTARAVTPAGLAARSFRATIGDGSTTAITIDHGLATRDVVVQLYDASSYETVYAQIVRTTTARVTATFNTAPANNDIIALITKVD